MGTAIKHPVPDWVKKNMTTQSEIWKHALECELILNVPSASQHM